MLHGVETYVVPTSGWALADSPQRIPGFPEDVPLTGRHPGGHFGITRAAIDFAKRLG